MTTGSAFPMFITAEYRRDAAGFPAFERDAADGARAARRAIDSAFAGSGESVRQQFQVAFNDVGRMAKEALQRSLNDNGRLDLNLPGFQQAAREARAYQQAVQELFDAARTLARQTGDTSSETRQFLAALEAQVVESRQAVAAADAQTASYAKLQEQLDRTASRTSSLATAMRDLYQQQAAAARAEVLQGEARIAFDTTLARQGVGATSGKSAAAAAEIFREAAALEDLANAERNAARSADLLAQINRVVGVTATEAARSASESAGVFEQAFRAQERAAQEAEQAWLELARAQEVAERQAIAYRRTLESQSAFAPTSEIERFRQQVETIQQLTAGALSAPRNAFGSLSIDLQAYERGAQSARAQAIALREVATATDRAAKEAGDLSEATRRLVVAAGAAAREAEDLANAAEEEARAFTLLQGALNQTSSATQAVIRNNSKLNDSLYGGVDGLRAQRFALVQTGQQLQDFTVSLSSGQKLSTVLIQQLPQLAFAMTGFGGKVGRVAEKLAGLQGFLIITAVALAAEFAPALFGASEASDELAKRQDSLADYLDRATGKIKEQVTWLDILQGKRDLEAEHEKNQRTFDRARGNFLSTLTQADNRLDPTGRVANPNPVSQEGLKLLRQTYRDLESGAIDAAKAVQLINAAAAKDKSLAGAAKDVEKVAFAYNDAKKEIDATNLQIARLAVAQGTATEAQKKLVEANRDSNTSTARAIELASQEATATTDVERARARLEQVKLRGADIDKKGADAQQQYRRDLDAANIALNQAQAAAEAARRAKSDLNRETREATKLSKEQDAAEERIRRISSQFDAQPRFADQQQAALRYLDDQIERYQKLNDQKSKQIVIEARAAKATVISGRDTRFEQFVEDQQQGLEIQTLRNAGYLAEADALQNIYQLQRQIGTLLPEQKDQVLAIARAYEAQRREAEETRKVVEAYSGMVSDVQSAIERLAGRTLSFKNPLQSLSTFGSDLVNSYVQTQIRVASEQLFRGVDQQLRDFVNPQQKLDTATTKAADSVEAFSRSLINATAALTGAQPGGAYAGFGFTPSFGNNNDISLTSARALAGDLRSAAAEALADARDTLGIAPANDNPSDDIVVTGQRRMVEELEKQTAIAARGYPSLAAATNRLGQNLGDNIVELARGSRFEGTANELKGVLNNLGDLLSGAAIGGSVGSVLFGDDKGAQVGSSVGGALGKVAGKEIGKQFGAQLGKLASFAGPIGGIVGGIAGGLVGGLFTKTKKGSASLGYDATTGMFTNAVTGNSQSYRDAADNLGNSVTGTLQKIADSLGGSIGDFSVSIGARKKNYVVDTTGSGRTKGYGTQSFKEESDAIQAAIADALRDGAIQGIRAGTQRLLNQGTDLDASLTRAAKFEGVFKSLQQALDPVGYAIDQLDRQFDDLKRVFAAAGASSEEYAQLEQLYSLQRADTIKQAASAMRSSLQGLLDDLKVGESGGLSLRDRLNNALAAYNPLAAQVRSGATNVDYDAFTEAARTVQELARELYGSQDGFFTIVDDIRALTEKALGDQQALIDMATGKTTPFDASTPSTSSPSTDNTPIVNGLTSVEQAIAQGFASMGLNLNSILSAIRAQGTTAIVDSSTILRREGF
ncbi:hypothetical protein [Rhizorhabdus sp.]|uniref:hypothetical protein n=1 Tax=Rhizorhabdus sp. TaxID=1968843 RepID=UPI0035B1300B